MGKDPSNKYSDAFPDLAAEFLRVMKGDLPEGWEAKLPAYPEGSKDIATRKASESVMQSLAPIIAGTYGRLSRPQPIHIHLA